MADTQRICTFSGCEKRVQARHLCAGHYKQWHLGKPLAPLKKTDYGEKCSVESCGRKHAAMGYCSGHYQQVKAGREPEPLRRQPIELTLVAATDRSGDCWVWTRSRNRAGYGHVFFEGKVHLAHRVSYLLAYGPVPEGLEIDHMCHNTSCIRPDHLRAVTRKQNIENRSGPSVVSKSGVRGVFWRKKDQKWVAVVGHENRKIHVGYFKNLKDAEDAVVAKRRELFSHNLVDRR